jgi:short subunit fatty acids transporter
VGEQEIAHMTTTPDTPARERWITRHVTYRLPIVGRMAREIAEGPVDNAFAAIFGVVAAVGSAVLIWGYPALIVSALLAAALMVVTLIRITLG